MTNTLKSLCLVMLFITAPTAIAYDFVPTEAEWQVWPPFCQARYVTVPPGDIPLWQSRVPETQIKEWKDILGSCWGAVHHHCAGLSKFVRAGTPGYDRKWTLIQSNAEYEFTRKNCPKDNQFWSNNESHRAMTLWELGDKLHAMEAVDEAIKANPGYDGSYIAKSVLLNRSGLKKEALQVLMDGDAATNGGSAEINNALGLALLNNKQFEAAREHARKAYQMGYPLPLLANKLREAGYPL